METKKAMIDSYIEGLRNNLISLEVYDRLVSNCLLAQPSALTANQLSFSVQPQPLFVDTSKAVAIPAKNMSKYMHSSNNKKRGASSSSGADVMISSSDAVII